MQHSDLNLLKRVRKQRCLRAEREYSKHRHDLALFAQKIDNQRAELQQLTINCQQGRASLGRQHQGAQISFQRLKEWQQKESELLNRMSAKSEEISSLQQQCEEQSKQVESARVALKQQQLSMEKLEELTRILNEEALL